MPCIAHKYGCIGKTARAFYSITGMFYDGVVIAVCFKNKHFPNYDKVPDTSADLEVLQPIAF